MINTIAQFFAALTALFSAFTRVASAADILAGVAENGAQRIADEAHIEGEIKHLNNMDRLHQVRAELEAKRKVTPALASPTPATPVTTTTATGTRKKP